MKSTLLRWKTIKQRLGNRSKLLFVLSRVASISFDRTVRAVLPFLVPLLIVLVLISIFPWITLVVPTYLYR